MLSNKTINYFKYCSGFSLPITKKQAQSNTKFALTFSELTIRAGTSDGESSKHFLCFGLCRSLSLCFCVKTIKNVLTKKVQKPSLCTHSLWAYAAISEIKERWKTQKVKQWSREDVNPLRAFIPTQDSHSTKLFLYSKEVSSSICERFHIAGLTTVYCSLIYTPV